VTKLTRWNDFIYSIKVIFDCLQYKRDRIKYLFFFLLVSFVLCFKHFMWESTVHLQELWDLDYYNHHNITEILWKVALNTITLNPNPGLLYFFYSTHLLSVFLSCAILSLWTSWSPLSFPLWEWLVVTSLFLKKQISTVKYVFINLYGHFG